MKKKILSILLALSLCLTLLPTAALADGPIPIPGEGGNTIDNPGGGGNTKPGGGGPTKPGIGDDDTTTTGGDTPTVGTTCTHVLGTDGKCTECGKTLIAEVTKTTENGGTATYYLAATGVTAAEQGVNDDVSLIADAFFNSSTTKVKLLADVKTVWTSASGSDIAFHYPNQTLDLNGHLLDNHGAGIDLSPSVGGDTPSLTITDSSAAKTGELKGSVSIDAGTLTVNSGTLTAEAVDQSTTPASLYADPQASDLVSGPIEITGGSMTISGTAKVSCSTITVEGSSGSSSRPGSLTVQDTAEITGGITVNQNGTLTMTGGKVQKQPSLTDADGLYVNGGTAKISGGTIDYLKATPGSTVELSGGIYGEVNFSGTNATALLKTGYAYFAKATTEDTDYTKLTAPTERTRTSTVENVAVKTHECRFSLNEDVGNYRCACGRSSTVQPIPYVDEDGNTAYCMEYKVLKSGGSDNILENQWYVLSGSLEKANLQASGDAHLILKNGAELTLKTVLQVDGGKSLTIYGQPAATGQTTGKLTVVGSELHNGGYIAALGDLTINGGDITVNTSASIDSLYADYGIINGIYSVAAANKLTVNGGSLTVNAPGLTNASSNDVFGVYAYDLTVNVGEITVTSAPITAKNGQVNSCGILTRKLTMTDGEVSATGAAITATYTYDPGNSSENCVASSAGISVEPDGDGTGAASITGGTLTATGGNVTASGSVQFMSTRSEGLCANDLLVDGATVEATGGNASLTANQPEGQDVTVRAMAFGYGISADMTVESGSITAKSGTAAATGCDNASYDARDFYGDLTMQGGTLTDGTAAGNVLASLNYLDMTGGTLKLEKGSVLNSVAASPLTAPLPEGCAYFEVNREFNTETWTTTETNVGFVTLGSQTALNTNESNSTAYYVKTCTHSATSGTCAYCGKDLGSAPDPTPTPSTGGGSSRPSYAVNAPATENGSVSVSPKNAKKGTSVTITVTPDAGFTLETLTILDKNGKEIELTDNGDGIYSFKMPAGKVEIRATFAEDNSMLNFFTDVPAGTFYYDAVLWAAKKGITGGIGENLFGPELGCGRAQLVTFLWRAAGCPAVDFAVDFTDVGDGYYSEAVRWAASLGIVSGYGNGLFGTDDTITREQMVTILYRFAVAMGMDVSAGEENNLLSYNDALEVSEYAIPAFQWATAAGIVQGADGSLMPNQPCTRAQIVTMLHRLLGK